MLPAADAEGRKKITRSVLRAPMSLENIIYGRTGHRSGMSAALGSYRTPAPAELIFLFLFFLRRGEK